MGDRSLFPPITAINLSGTSNIVGESFGGFPSYMILLSPGKLSPYFIHSPFLSKPKKKKKKSVVVYYVKANAGIFTYWTHNYYLM
jgi:uncharacterized membrane protein